MSDGHVALVCLGAWFVSAAIVVGVRIEIADLEANEIFQDGWCLVLAFWPIAIPIGTVVVTVVAVAFALAELGRVSVIAARWIVRRVVKLVRRRRVEYRPSYPVATVVKERKP